MERKNILNLDEKLIYILYIIGALISTTILHEYLTFPFLIFISLVFYKKTQNKKLFLIISLLTLFIEIIGVNTNFPFGEYTYLQALGPKLLGTPIVIGFLWAILIISSFNLGKIKGIISILILDAIIELQSYKLNFWMFKGNIAPIQNYLTWGLITFICYKYIKEDKKTKVFLYTNYVYFLISLMVALIS